MKTILVLIGLPLALGEFLNQTTIDFQDHYTTSCTGLTGVYFDCNLDDPGTECIEITDHPSFVCGATTCSTDADEYCAHGYIQCDVTDSKCYNCIPEEAVYDGVADCTDGMDEDYSLWDECLYGNFTCGSNSTCNDTATTDVECICDDGFTMNENGTCDTTTTTTSATTTTAYNDTCSPCNDHGNYTCSCYDGWTGDYCDEEVDYCSMYVYVHEDMPGNISALCGDYGTCISNSTGAYCACDGNWTGDFCQTPATDSIYDLLERCNIRDPVTDNGYAIGCDNADKNCIPDDLNCLAEVLDADGNACDPVGYCIYSAKSQVTAMQASLETYFGVG